MAQMMVIKRWKLMRMTRTRISFLRKTSMMWRRKSEQLKRSLVDAEGVGGWEVSYFRIFMTDIVSAAKIKFQNHLMLEIKRQ